MRVFWATLAVLSLLGVAACGGGGPGSANLECSGVEANRPDLPRQEVAGTIAPALPRRTCTQPQDGCVAVPNAEGRRPPAPGIRVDRVTPSEIEIDYDLGSNLEDCRPHWLTVALSRTVSGMPPEVHEVEVSDSAGSVRIKPRDVAGTTDFGPLDLLVAGARTRDRLMGDYARIRLPAPDGEQALSQDEVRRLQDHREACRADIDDKTTCDMGAQHPVDGPVTLATPEELAMSIRETLEGEHSMEVVSVECLNGTRCNASFVVSNYALEMSYLVEALESVPTCWELTGFSVVRPVPQLSGFAAPLPVRGCIDR